MCRVALLCRLRECARQGHHLVQHAKESHGRLAIGHRPRRSNIQAHNRMSFVVAAFVWHFSNNEQTNRMT